MRRARLPNRRFAETTEVEHGGTRFMVTVGYYPDGRPGEVFTHGAFNGSALDALLADACVLVSHLIQHGVMPRDLADSMGRLSNAGPASIIGAVIDVAAKADVGCAEIDEEACEPSSSPALAALPRSTLGRCYTGEDVEVAR